MCVCVCVCVFVWFVFGDFQNGFGFPLLISPWFLCRTQPVDPPDRHRRLGIRTCGARSSCSTCRRRREASIPPGVPLRDCPKQRRSMKLLTICFGPYLVKVPKDQPTSGSFGRLSGGCQSFGFQVSLQSDPGMWRLPVFPRPLV